MTDHPTAIADWLEWALTVNTSYLAKIDVSDLPTKQLNTSSCTQFVIASHPLLSEINPYLHSYTESWIIRLDADSRENLEGMTNALISMCDLFNRRSIVDTFTISPADADFTANWLVGNVYNHNISALEPEYVNRLGKIHYVYEGNNYVKWAGYIMKFDHQNLLAPAYYTPIYKLHIPFSSLPSDFHIYILDSSTYSTSNNYTIKRDHTTQDSGTTYSWTIANADIPYENAVMALYRYVDYVEYDPVAVPPTMTKTYTYTYPTGLVHTNIKSMSQDFPNHNRFCRTLKLECEWWF